MSDAPPGKTIDLGLPNQKLLICIGEAFQAYAGLEMGLCMLFANLLGTAPDAAGIVFYRIVNTRSRTAILEGLMKRNYGATYNKFFKSLMKAVGSIDGRRANIAHWHTIPQIDLEKGVATYRMIPPNFWASTPETPFFEEQDLRSFSDESTFLAQSVMHFAIYLARNPMPAPWPDIFQQSLVYPPPNTHPLSPAFSAQQTQPPPSQE